MITPYRNVKLLFRTARRKRFDYVDALPKKLIVQWYNIACNCISIVSCIAGLIIDISIGTFFYLSHAFVASALIYIFTFIPAIFIGIINLKWYIDDRDLRPVSRLTWAFRIILFFMQLSPTLRLIDSIKFGIKFRRKSQLECISSAATDAAGRPKVEPQEYYLRMLEEDRDAALLRLFAAFLESAPQLCIQLFVVGQFYVSRDPRLCVIYQTCSLAYALCSLSWSLVSYQRCLRLVRQDKNNLKVIGTVLMFCWRLCTICSRAFSLVFFALAFSYLVIIVVLFHLILISIFVYTYESFELAEQRGLVTKFLQFIIILVHIFVPFNFLDRPTKVRYVVLYSVEFVEMLILIVAPLFYQRFLFPGKLLMICAILILFVVGMIFMLIYYGFFHPSLPAVRCAQTLLSPSSIMSLTAVAAAVNEENQQQTVRTADKNVKN